MIVFALMAIIILAGASGDICMTRGMKSAGEITNFHPLALIGAAFRALQSGYIWLGAACKGLAFVSFLALLSRADLSWVVPAAATTYVVDTLAAKYLLSEKVNSIRWAGTLCVFAGVILVSL